jgi:hypothetical protein
MSGWKLNIEAPNGAKTEVVADSEEGLKAHIDEAIETAKRNDPEPIKGNAGQPAVTQPIKSAK